MIDMSYKVKDTIKINMSESGLFMFFKPYQVEILRFLQKEKEQTSRDVYQHLLFRVEMNVSRASIINSLNMFSDWGILVFYTDIGKGGIHRVYSMNEKLKSEIDIIEYIYKNITKKIQEEIKI